MEKWWESRYFNKQVWILEHVQKFNLSALDCVVLQQLSLTLDHREEVTLVNLSQKCNVSIKQLDETLTKLIQKGWVAIDMDGPLVRYNLDGLYAQEKQSLNAETTDIVEIYEREFKRPLSTHEIEKINDWLMKVDHAFLIHALREAIIYRKVNMNYIDRILIQWVNDKVTLEQLNAGQRHERNS